MNNPPDHPFREFERAGWERAAARYSDSFERVTAPFAAPLLDAVEAKENTRLLDIACGTGLVAATAASRGARVIGVDFSESMRREAARLHPAIEFRTADAENLPFSDGAFDAVTIGFGVNHFPFPIRALKEARRVLRPQGRLAFTLWAPTEIDVLQGIVVEAVRRSGNAAAALPIPPSGAIIGTEACLELLRESGFDGMSLRAEFVKTFIPIESGQKLLSIFSEGTVRTAAVIRSLSNDRKSVLLAVIEQAIEKYRDKDGFFIPAVALLAVGVKL